MMLQAEVGGIEAGSEAARERFRDLEARMNRVSTIGTRIGDRLQVGRGRWGGGGGD